jgi:hypothetical protein
MLTVPIRLILCICYITPIVSSTQNNSFKIKIVFGMCVVCGYVDMYVYMPLFVLILYLHPVGE